MLQLSGEPFKLRFSTKRDINYLHPRFANDRLIPREMLQQRCHWRKLRKDNTNLEAMLLFRFNHHMRIQISLIYTNWRRQSCPEFGIHRLVGNIC